MYPVFLAVVDAARRGYRPARLEIRGTAKGQRRLTFSDLMLRSQNVE